MTVALLRMVAPFFGPKIDEDQTKQKVFAAKQVGFWSK